MEAIVDTAGGSSADSSSNIGAVEGGGGAIDAAKKRKQEEEWKGRGAIEGAGTIAIEGIPDEILLKVLSLLFGKTLMVYAPQVCKRWRKLCPEIKNVHLDYFTWFNGKKCSS